MSYHWQSVCLIFTDGEFRWPDVEAHKDEDDLRAALIGSFEDLGKEAQTRIGVNFDWMEKAPIEDVIDAVLAFGEQIWNYKGKSGTAYISITKVVGPYQEPASGEQSCANLDLLAPKWTDF